jgi:hypothetical protein
MSSHLMRGLGLLGLALAAGAVQGAGPQVEGKQPREQPAVAALARKIDDRIDAGLKERKVVAAPIASDSAFIRRVYLDLAGRIPRVSEVRAFLDDKRSNKRALLVEKLLDGSNYISHFTNVWRSLLLPQTNQQVQFFAGQMEQWARTRVRDNTPYDKMVRDLPRSSPGSGPRWLRKGDSSRRAMTRRSTRSASPGPRRRSRRSSSMAAIRSGTRRRPRARCSPSG